MKKLTFVKFFVLLIICLEKRFFVATYSAKLPNRLKILIYTLKLENRFEERKL